MNTVADRLRKAIDQKGLSYGELAQITGIPKSALQRYATGETRKIPLDRVSLLADALGVSAAEILGWTTETDIPPGFEPMSMLKS